jgi:hypothetical protein
MELHEGHEAYHNPDRDKRSDREIPTGWLHAVRPGKDFAYCSEGTEAPIRVTDSGQPWQRGLMQCCRRCQDMTRGQ